MAESLKSNPLRIIPANLQSAYEHGEEHGDSDSDSDRNETAPLLPHDDDDDADYDNRSCSASSISSHNLFLPCNEEIDIDELRRLLISLIKKLNDVKINEFVKFLTAKKKVVDQSYRKQNAAVATFSGVSVAGGVVMLVGAASTLATFGASLSLVIAGGVTVGIGAFGTVTAEIGGKLHRWLVIRQCKNEIKKIESRTEKIGEIYEPFRNKCIGVCKTLEEHNISFDNLKEFNPILFKFAFIGWLNTRKVAAIGTATAGIATTSTHLATAAHAGHMIAHLRFLGKMMVPTFKISTAVIGIGMAISGIGIALDLIIGGKALCELARGTECSESEKLSLAISKAEEHAERINSYLHLLEHDAKDLLDKAMDATKSMRQQLREKTDIIQQLRNANDKNKAEIEQLRRAGDEHKAEIARLKAMLINQSKCIAK